MILIIAVMAAERIRTREDFGMKRRRWIWPRESQLPADPVDWDRRQLQQTIAASEIHPQHELHLSRSTGAVPGIEWPRDPPEA